MKLQQRLFLPARKSFLMSDFKRFLPTTKVTQFGDGSDDNEDPLHNCNDMQISGKPPN